MTIDPNDPGTLDLDLGPPVTVEGWGTGTTVELADYIAQLKAERDAAQANERKLERQLHDDDVAHGRVLFHAIEGIVERLIEAHFDGPGADALEGIIDRRVEEAVELVRDDLRSDVRNALHDAADSI